MTGVLAPLANPLLLVAAGLAVVLVAPKIVRALGRAGRGGDGADWPFTSRKPLSRVEQVLYFRLAQALPEFVVLAQVPLSSFLRVRRGRTWHEWHNRIAQKSVDFLVCERDFSIVTAIELDDATHERDDRAHADRTKSRALTAAGVRLVRWRTTELPDVATIRRIVDALRDTDRERSVQVSAPLVPSLDPGFDQNRSLASNDPSIFHEETRR